MKFVKTNIVNSWQAPSIWDLDQHWTWRMTKHGNRTNWKRVMPLFILWKQGIKLHKKNLNIMKFVKTNIVNSWQAPSIWDLDQHWTWRMTKHGNRTNWKRVMPLFIPWKQALRVLKHRGIRKLRCSALKMQPLLKIGWGVLS